MKYTLGRDYLRTADDLVHFPPTGIHCQLPDFLFKREILTVLQGMVSLLLLWM